jgi:hypothetical protein
MAGESAPAEGAVSGANRRAAIEVTVDQRWDAMALCELLVPFNSYLVQYTPERWVVRGRAPGCHASRSTARWPRSPAGRRRAALRRRR